MHATGVHLAMAQYRIVALLEQSVVADRDSDLQEATVIGTRWTIIANDARPAFTVCAGPCSALARQFQLLAPNTSNSCTGIPSSGDSAVFAQALVVCSTGRKD